MTVSVIKPGLQTTIQSAARTGMRHLGVPASGPADALSMALANRLVGNLATASALETTLTGVSLKFEVDTGIAITGAPARCAVNNDAIEQHTTIVVRSGDVLTVGAAEHGARTYVAIAGGLNADETLGSSSTYMTAGLGGHCGRALLEGDVLSFQELGSDLEQLATPDEFRLPILDSWSVRACHSVETASLSDPSQLFDTRMTVSNRSDRMGIRLDGQRLSTDIGGQMPSAPVFPGIVQCPADGHPFILSVDSGTTGGYPRIAKVARADLHIIGQLRPGNSFALLRRTDEQAAKELREKHAYWRSWLPDVASVI